jgi:hypothetical protein
MRLEESCQIPSIRIVLHGQSFFQAQFYICQYKISFNVLARTNSCAHMKYQSYPGFVTINKASQFNQVGLFHLAKLDISIAHSLFM